MKAKRNILILGVLFNFFFSSAQELVSPNEKIKVELQAEKGKMDRVYFKISYKNNDVYTEVLPLSQLGILQKNERFDSLEFIGESKIVEIQDDYQMICGKRAHCENFGSEKKFSFKNKNNQKLDIVFRAYNNGVAFQYVFPNQSEKKINITEELTTYNIPEGTSRWIQPFQVSYEEFFPQSNTGINPQKNSDWGFPALYKVNEKPVWVLISEAGITENHCASMLNNSQKPSEYKVTYPAVRDDFKQIGVVTKLPWSSPWHTFAIGNLSDIAESNLVTDVSKPNELKDTDWIKPGAVSWIYWAYNHGSKDYKKVVEYVDLAVEMKWPYVLIDWEWDVMANGGNLEDASNYAKSKGIKPLIWYNSGTSWLEPTPVDRLLTAEKRKKEFEWLNKIGIYGIKVDFFAGDQQDMMQYYIDILKDAAKYRLLVNFHGATVPRGWARTYPNLMTTEAVYGAEWYNNKAVLTDKAAVHNTTLPFTRNVVGSMDYTPVTFSDSQHPHITSFGHELALSVVFESGLQHFADRPSAYYDLPTAPKEFLKNFPTTWDDTKLIDGFPGEKVIMARKKNNLWYIGGLNGKDSAQTLTLNFDFLDNGNYELQLITDGKDSKSLDSKILKVKKGETIKIDCLSRGGFAGVLKAK
ncbi:glycoside hydrolase family 97 protein [Flavobacterium sp. YJ01]|uniref:glycoside hydrolase family 97 protein n=1 Tax=unclassified Flavobacterium TaxID=196869 RepID=UPI0023E3E072|nr:glycoside hydrolase family 97 protein [Flavobacterium sp. YJ01]WET01796.1 glycoside hydrolase family 97 catalytic domain-containing protein [Flavobacterium sp. YJ01]